MDDSPVGTWADWLKGDGGYCNGHACGGLSVIGGAPEQLDK
ncbi:MAG TPA: hypothetical protein VG013_24900 [Gemmataceae bacterium]|jgi:hypothetical protein|nr:hypothetical protein [Gemmataceae bacterium]